MRVSVKYGKAFDKNGNKAKYSVEKVANGINILLINSCLNLYTLHVCSMYEYS